MDHSEKIIAPVTQYDLDDLVQQAVEMVLETEGKIVPPEMIKKSAQILLENDRLGYFYKHLCRDPNDNNNSEGTFMITYELNLYDPCSVWWIQSVYVKPQYRRQKVFTRIFNQIQSQAFSQKFPIKLYVEVENQKAIQVYQNLGMKKCPEIVYEDDFFFYPLKKQLYSDPQMSSYVAEKHDLSDVVRFIKISHSIFGFKLNTDNLSQRVGNLMEKTEKDGSIILTKKNDEIKMMTSYFTEFSDWRCGVILWIYDIRTQAKTDKETLNLMIQNMISYCKTLKKTLNVVGIRFIFDESQNSTFRDLLEDIGLTRSHYYIFSKQP